MFEATAISPEAPTTAEQEDTDILSKAAGLYTTVARNNITLKEQNAALSSMVTSLRQQLLEARDHETVMRMTQIQLLTKPLTSNKELLSEILQTIIEEITDWSMTIHQTELRQLDRDTLTGSFEHSIQDKEAAMSKRQQTINQLSTLLTELSKP